MKNSIIIIVKIFLTVLFLCCLLDMPYVYFQIVRVLGMGGFAWLAYIDSEKKDKSLMIVWICSAILINPIFKIVLGRTIWNVVDVIWALVLIVTLVFDVMNRKKNKMYET